MLYAKERIEVICAELKKQSQRTWYSLTRWDMKKGNYVRPVDAEKDPQAWMRFDSHKDHWYGPDGHYWFKTGFTVPEEMRGKPLWFRVSTQIDECDDGKNPQFLLFINGEVTQGLDMNHREVLLTDRAVAGYEYDLQIAAYTGTLHTEFRLIADVAELIEPVYGLYYDIAIPLWSLDHMEKDNRTRLDIETALNDTINLLDLREPYSKGYYESVEAARAHIAEALYDDMAGSDDVIATCIGHTHIDVAWWWTVKQTREKVARSFSTVLKLMEEYPQYLFMSSQPQLYAFVKERYPELYARIKERVGEGRWEPEGGMWLEADCNLTSGESLVRQFLYGKKFFRDEFGIESVILWLPDVFGYPAALPQIMKKSGIKYFMTTKISWNQINKFPYDTFFWRGIDGTEIFTHLITTKGVKQDKDSFFTTYNGMLHPAALMGGWERYQQKELNHDILIAYGYGDGGGGPTREMLETGIRMESGLKGAPRVRFATARRYFDELYERLAEDPRLPKWVGELYLEYHRGTYTSMARNKRSNRKAELALQDLEFFSVWAEDTGIPYPKKELDKMWKTVLLNQFHDILPGSSIKEVYEVTREEYTEINQRMQKLISERTGALADTAGDDLVLFNTLSFVRDDIVIIDDTDAAGLIDADGNLYPVQKTGDGKEIAYVKGLPAKGCRAYAISGDAMAVENVLHITADGIETPFYSVRIDDDGQFISLYDKDNAREVLIGNGNVLRVYEDKPMYYDNWDIDIYYTEKSWTVDDIRRMEWIERGPVRATLLLEYGFSRSCIRQKVHFYADTRRIDFETYVDWNERQHLLKVEFPVDVNAAEATYDIQFGNIKRPTHSNTSWDVARFEVCGHKWADLSEGRYGVSLLNDCKYGYGIHDGTITLSLIKSGIEPNPTADQEAHFFIYSLLPHGGDWKQGDTVRQAYMLNVPLYSTRGKGSGRNQSSSLLKVYGDNVILETVKRAEDGEGVIVRLYEYKNARSQITIEWHRPFTAVYECDLMDNITGKLSVRDGAFSFEIKPYEIKTFKIV
jgi:alpha-mannosidase